MSRKNAFSSRNGTARNEGGISSRVVFWLLELENASDWLQCLVLQSRSPAPVVTMAPFSHRRAGPTSRRWK